MRFLRIGKQYMKCEKVTFLRFLQLLGKYCILGKQPYNHVCFNKYCS